MRCAALVGAVFAARAGGWQRGWCGLGAGCGLDGALMRRGVVRQAAGGHAGSTLAGMRFGWRADGNCCRLRNARCAACDGRAVVFFIMQKHGGRQVLPVNFAGKGTGGDDG